MLRLYQSLRSLPVCWQASAILQLPRMTSHSSHPTPHTRIGYIGEFEIVDDHRSGKIVVNLIGRINKVGVISPRFDVKIGEVEKWVNNLLPSRQFGHIVLTTSVGIFDHEEARRKRTGGKVLGVSCCFKPQGPALHQVYGSLVMYLLRTRRSREPRFRCPRSSLLFYSVLLLRHHAGCRFNCAQLLHLATASRCRCVCRLHAKSHDELGRADGPDMRVCIPGSSMNGGLCGCYTPPTVCQSIGELV